MYKAEYVLASNHMTAWRNVGRFLLIYTYVIKCSHGDEAIGNIWQAE